MYPLFSTAAVPSAAGARHDSGAGQDTDFNAWALEVLERLALAVA